MNKSQTSKKIRIFISNTFDPYFNLATEDWIFRDMNPHVHTLFLWRNEDTVVIGRFQNPWAECNTDRMKQDGVHLARRQSGGGAVFQDLGNTNFTFMSSKDNYSQSRNNQIIINALKKFNINASASGRNDLTVRDDQGERKFSGSAFKKGTDRCFHHGTLLLNANLEKLSDYLNPNKKKLESKGLKSVKARVVNLNIINPEINHEVISQEIIKEFCFVHANSCEVETLDHQYLKTIPSLNEYYEKLKHWDWRFGKTPDFNHQIEERFEWGHVEVHLNTHRGTIEEAQIFSDCLYPEFIAKTQAFLVSQPYSEIGIASAMDKVRKELVELRDHPMIDNFRDWLSQQIQ